MKRITQFFRLLKINIILMRYTFTPAVVGSRYPIIRFLAYINPWRMMSKKSRSRGESIRFALISLGPIFVKFGQLLSTRRDLLPEDIANELALLQDQVPPFPSRIARHMIEENFKNSINQLFSYFEDTPLASASIAQVHAASLPNGESVVVKILRPTITQIISHDIALMYFVARFAERFWSKGRRLHPVELVAEFESTIVDELDLQREAANASQLRRNFLYSPILYVPKIYWQYAHTQVMVMERIHGVRISDIERLRALNCNFKKLAETGVEMFFTQVFRDNFFHADMHPGNLFVDCTDPNNPKLIVVDFGIVGSLSPEDNHYLAQNLLAFLDRNYRQVAILHVESGWLPANTRVEQFEAAIRTVCEPIFEQPMEDISFGQLLLRLFTTAERFNMEVQPQLLLLQKTLLNIEGIGRQLYPQLDIWKTAKPFMERWIREQHGPKRWLKLLRQEGFENFESLLKLPNLLYSFLQTQQQLLTTEEEMMAIGQEAIYLARKRHFAFGGGAAFLVMGIANQVGHLGWFPANAWWPWALGAALLLAGWMLPSNSAKSLRINK
jgi:ubiquinone biosynthesis protein